jgi:hypothetical protein
VSASVQMAVATGAARSDHGRVVKLPGAMRVSALDLAPRGHEAARGMRQITGEQLGSALRRLAADLVAERRRVAVLQRENRELRERIQELERALSARKGRYAGSRKAA